MDIPLDRFDAILFDLDGTLVDTMPMHHQAYQSVFIARGMTLDWPTFMSIVGAPARETIKRFVQAAGRDCDADEAACLHAEKKAVFERNLASAKPPLLPAAHLLSTIRRSRRCGLVSSGNRRGVEAILDALGWSEWFEVVVTGDDVFNGKPHPEPYLRAAKALNVAPSSCLVLEDTKDGLDSARAAGMSAFDVAELTIARDRPLA